VIAALTSARVAQLRRVDEFGLERGKETSDHGIVVAVAWPAILAVDGGTSNSVCFDLEKGDLTVPQIPQDDEEVRIVLGVVWKSYKRYTAWALRNKTHEPNTPWSEVYSAAHQFLMA
jgi:uncharacterized phage-associated protein